MTKTFERILANNYTLIMVLVVPAFLLYFKSLQFDFTTLDDQWLIVDNPSLKTGWAGFKKVWLEAISGTYYRPLLTGSFFMDFKMGRLSPAFYHFNNLVMHLICVVLLYRFLVLNKVTKNLAYVLALLFSVHPVVLHAVVWIPGRNDLLLCLFTLASLNHLLKFLSTGQTKFIVYHFIFFICALLTKESGVVLPFIFAVIMVVYKRDSSTSFLYFIFGWAGVSLTWFFLRNLVISVQPDLNFNMLFFKNVIPAFLIFTGKTILPIQQSVLPTLKNTSIIPGILSVVAIVVLNVKPGLKNKQLAYAGLLIYGTLLAIPVWFSAGKTGSEYYEHRMYTSMAGIVLFISQLKFNWNSDNFKAIALLFFCFFCYRSYTRMDVYKNTETFVSTGSRESPDFYLFMFQKSGILFNQQQYDSALVYIDRALAIRQDRPEMFTNRGSINYMLGNYNQAVIDFNKAILISKTFDHRMYLNRGFAYCRNGEFDKAMQDLATLKKCCPSVIPQEFEKEISTKWKASKDSIK